jgi:hypothetical protein
MPVLIAGAYHPFVDDPADLDAVQGPRCRL